MTNDGARTLRSVAVSARSKNAGPFAVTMDIFFGDAETFDEITSKRVINEEAVATAYRVDPSVVEIYNFRPALAVKVTIPRIVSGGAPGDTDVAGGQQFIPLLEFEIA